MLKKSLIAAGAIAAAVIAFQPATADAGVSVTSRPACGTAREAPWRMGQGILINR